MRRSGPVKVFGRREYPEVMPSKADRRAGREAVATYQEAQLAVLVAHVGEAVDRFHASELDAFGVDQVLYQYSRAAKELWMFCNYVSPEIAARVLAEEPPGDWWERGAPHPRR